MTRALLVSLVLASCLLALRGQVQAQAAVSVQEGEYQRTIDAALEEYRAAHYEEARGLFEHAHELEPSARTLRGLGMVEFELRHYVRSAELLTRSLASHDKALTDEQQSAVRALLERTRHFVAQLHVQLVPAEAAAQLEVDGQQVVLPADRKVTVSAGEHRLLVLAPGYQPSELTVDAQGGVEQELRVELHPLAPEPVARSRGAPVAQEDSHAPAQPVRPHRTLGIVLFASGLAELAAAATLGPLALHQANEAVSRDGTQADRARRLALGAVLALGIGAASVVSGVILWFWRKGETPPAARAGVELKTVLPQLQVVF